MQTNTLLYVREFSHMQWADMLLPIVISTFLAFIAYQQMVINRNKLKFDLYNKRFEIYTTALQFYQEVTSDEYTKKEHRDFISKKESAFFLFSDNKKIYELLNEMHTKSFVINGFRKSGAELKGSPEAYMSYQNNFNEALNWFEKVIDELRDEMSHYLKF
jgi:anaerobic ribonucleoside-triphosphate reductase